MNVKCPHCKEEITELGTDTHGGLTGVRYAVFSCPKCHTILGIR